MPAERQRADLGQTATDDLVHRAKEYDVLMQTLTMRVLRRPRAWYATARRRAPDLVRFITLCRKRSGPSPS